ncbi:MAG: MoaD/ThiS family protein [Gammaproteobacteria bacterium]|uniref:MoaD/ThiS family protein n=1 Tax=Limnobacter sp. TaxID=2003368 RepID=UPI001D47AE5E|nr:MoaD/ThiS family protein [Limnobacter sp.]MBU0784945.1 MoaD/ThiS family protein [Gammaproteobacteria bacterium]MBU0848984.1 MoaD/ThiS family protein [Gammaproteobacteria bacterium]MBU1268274.1 MoaD/ThiS family protein [Gammaproteobacteria bacterium]MBU1527978.1 MoaD/ThiS family protein [Gammaproteobacteria bacterium]MBU1781321.1 MoaD/ThiS family protein [Gammaproteobacteria bacterium]
MEITFKLFATLTDYLPANRVDNAVRLQIQEGSTVQQIIDQFHLPEKLTHLVLVNGVYVDQAERVSKVLTPDDVLAIWPPIAGG